MDEVGRGFHSKFGGLWIDQLSRPEVRRRINSITDADLRQQAMDFERDGLVVLKEAVSHSAIDEYLSQYRAAASSGQLVMSVPFGPMSEPYTEEKSMLAGAKVLDTSMLLPMGVQLSFARPIRDFLSTMFEGPALAFQSLHFEVGSTQSIHQDTAYVVVNREPLHMIASWIALEDVVPGSGELIYYVGGHRMPEYLYADGTSKNFDAARDGNDPHTKHLSYLHEEAARRGLVKSSFVAIKGDVCCGTQIYRMVEAKLRSAASVGAH
jgi:phytanoyl-CoA dioxygenase PhyH